MNEAETKAELSDPALKRATAFLSAHPDFSYRGPLAATLRHGWLEQEQSKPGTLDKCFA